MSNLKNISSEKDLYLFIAFHVPDDSDSAANILRLKDLVSNKFEDAISNTTEPESLGSYEVIYKIPKPLLKEDENFSIFFSSLEEIFKITSHLSPHFTQVNLERD